VGAAIAIPLNLKLEKLHSLWPAAGERGAGVEDEGGGCAEEPTTGGAGGEEGEQGRREAVECPGAARWCAFTS